jgi:hypothetical protein
MSRHTITHADEIFVGAPQAGGYNGALRGVAVSLLHKQVIESPIAGDVDGLVTAAGSGATAAAGDVPIDGAFLNAVTGFGDISGPRNLEIVSTNAGDTTQVLTITGRDIVGNPQVEQITANGVTVVPGLKAFSVVESISNSLVFAGNLTVGTSVTLANIEFGLDAGLVSIFDVVHALTGATPAAEDGGTFTIADATAPATAITGDTKGSYSPGNAPNGTVDYILWYAADLTKDGYGENFTG